MQALDFYESITKQYLKKYDFKNIIVDSECITTDDIRDNLSYLESKISKQDLPIIILDLDVGLNYVVEESAWGHYQFIGNIPNHIAFCACSPYVESEGSAHTLSHELSHFVLHQNGEPISITKDWVHQNQADYNECEDDDYSKLSCPNLWTTVKAPSGKHIPVMAIYDGITSTSQSSPSSSYLSPTIPVPVTPPDTTSDYDGDGIPDYRDECVYIKENYNGYEDTDGCLDFKSLEPVPTNDFFSDFYDGQFEIESSVPKIETKIEKKGVQIYFSINALSDEVKVFEGVELEGKLYYISPKGNELGIANERVQLKNYNGFSVIETLSTDYAGNFKWESSRNPENYDEETGTSSWDLYLYFEANERYHLNSKAIGTVTIQNPNILPESEITKSEISESKEEQFCFLFWCW